MNKLLLLSLAVFAAAAVGCKGGGAGGSGGVAGIGPASHKPDECPNIDGKYVRNDDKGRAYKTIKTELLPDGVRLKDTGLTLSADGKSHPAEGPDEAFYTGYCQAGSIHFDISVNGKRMGRISYSQGAGGEIVIQQKAADPNSKENLREVWLPE